METAMRRMLTLCACLCAAAGLFTAALVVGQSDARSASGTEHSITVPEPAPAPEPAPPDDEASDPSTIYVLRSVDGELCVFRGRTLLHRTGVYTSTLPREDQLLLDTGISAASQEALASLLEDMCS